MSSSSLLRKLHIAFHVIIVQAVFWLPEDPLGPVMPGDCKLVAGGAVERDQPSLCDTSQG
jgi:hypothetical protein